MKTGHEVARSPESSLFAPITRRLAEGVRTFRTITRHDQKEVLRAADLGLLGKHEAQFACAGLEKAREKILGRSKF